VALPRLRATITADYLTKITATPSITDKILLCPVLGFVKYCGGTPVRKPS